jgi:hypothetical protein
VPIFSLKEPLVLQQGTGFLISPNNTELDASERQTVTLSIPQTLGSGSNIVINQLNVTSKIIIIDDETLILQSDIISGSFTNTGTQTVSGDYNISGSLTIGGTIVAEQIQSELTQSATIFKSGSSQFGNSSDDTHTISGSLIISSSIQLSGYTIDEISNDDTLVDGSTTSVVTENAVKGYIGNTEAKRSYLRKSFAHTGSFVSVSTASFTAATASAPSGFTSTSEDDYMFFNNGMIMEHDALIIQQTGSLFLLKVNNNSIGYDLQSSDELVAFGRFNS